MLLELKNYLPAARICYKKSGMYLSTEDLDLAERRCSC